MKGQGCLPQSTVHVCQFAYTVQCIDTELSFLNFYSMYYQTQFSFIIDYNYLISKTTEYGSKLERFGFCSQESSLSNTEFELHSENAGQESRAHTKSMT